MLSTFEYFSPRSIEEAMDLLSQKKETMNVLAEGIDPKMAGRRG